MQTGDPIAAPLASMFKGNIGIHISPLLMPWQRETFGRVLLVNGTSLSKSPKKDKSVDVHWGMETV